MINLTKSNFKAFCETNLIQFDTSPVLIATLNLQSSTNRNLLGHIPSSGMFTNVSVIPEQQFTFQSPRAAPFSIVNGAVVIDAANKVLVLTSEPIGKVVVIYELKDASYNFDGVFRADVNIISIDYINEKVLSITFPEKIPSLQEINLADGRTTVSGYIKDLRVSDENRLYVGNSNRMPYQKGSFKGKKLVLPYSGSGTLSYTIPANCFAGNTELLEVVIPRSCYGIGAGAFKGCTNLRHVFISNETASIGAGAFDGCTYEDIEFEVEAGNVKYVGLTGCLLEHNDDDTYTILHATAGFFDPDSDNFYGKTKVCFDTKHTGNFPSSFIANTYPFFNTYPWAGMYSKTGGNVVLVDNRGYTITDTGRLITTKDTSIIMDTAYAIPIYFLIKEIAPNACAGDTNMTNVTLAQWTADSNHVITNSFVPGLWLLDTIGAGAFKGCGISTLKMLATYNNSDYAAYSSWNGHEVDICESAFEGCTSLVQLDLYDSGYLGKKAFYGCAGLTAVRNHSNMFISDTSLDGVGKNSYNQDRRYNRVGELCFGDTPNLSDISGYNTAADGIFSSDQVRAEGSFGSSNRLLVAGCKNTGFSAYTYIGEGALYKCTSLTGTVGLDNTLAVGQFAFYGCTGISALTFRANAAVFSTAFYGCTSLHNLSLCEHNTAIALYSQAFAKSGVTSITANYNKINLQTLDVFDDCPISMVSVSGTSSGTGSPHPVAPSATGSENALMTKYTSTGNPMTLVKGGEATKTVNNWSSSDGNLTEIKSNAFVGNLNVNNTGTVTIPNTVTKLGSTIFKGSGVGNDAGNTSFLTLARSVVVTECVLTQAGCVALLYKIGAKYFSKILRDTEGYAGRGHHYYRVEEESGNLIRLVEYAENSSRSIWEIGYDSNNNVVLTCIYVVLPDYREFDNEFHSVPAEPPVSVILLYDKQPISTARAANIFDNSIVPGSKWEAGKDIQLNIPDGIPTQDVGQYSPFTITDTSFSDTTWLTRVNAGRSLGNMKAGFKNCTQLALVTPLTPDDDWWTVDNSLFNGYLPESIFEGCEALKSFANQDTDYIVNYGKASLKGSHFNNTNNILAKATTFGVECCAGTAMETMEIPGIQYLDSTSFNNNDLRHARTFGYSGVYFCVDNESICDDGGRIVVGTRQSAFNMHNGVETNAFKGLTQAFDVAITNQNGYSIAKTAFVNSHITTYTETNCSATSFGDNAFENCVYLTSVTINPSATLGKGLFKGCTALAAVTIPQTVNIPEDCFSGCARIASFTTRADIAAGAFSNCTSLTTLNLVYTGSDNPTIVPDAFRNCPLTELKSSTTSVNAGNYVIGQHTIYEIGDDITVLLGTADYNDVHQIDVPVTAIGDYAFCGRGITGDIVIPDSVTRIGDYAFANNPGITGVNIPSTVKHIGDHAFDGCSNISYFALPDSCTYLGEAALKGCGLINGFNCNALDSQYTTWCQQTGVATQTTTEFNNTLDLTAASNFNSISDSAFAATQIKAVRFPRTCDTIGNRAFYQCSKLTEIEINSNGLVIGYYAFYGCQMLRSVWIASNVTTAPTLTNADVFYGVGTSVTGNKILHVPSTLNTNVFKSTLFYTTLVTTNGFNVDWYNV